MRDGFSFYKSFDDVYQKLNDEQKVRYIDTLLDVQFLRVKLDDVVFNDVMLDLIWASQKHSFQKSIKGYLDSQKSDRIKEPYLGCYQPVKTPQVGSHKTPKEGVCEQVQGKGEVQGKEKEEEEEEGQGEDVGDVYLEQQDYSHFYADYCKESGQVPSKSKRLKTEDELKLLSLDDKELAVKKYIQFIKYRKQKQQSEFGQVESKFIPQPYNYVANKLWEEIPDKVWVFSERVEFGQHRWRYEKDKKPCVGKEPMFDNEAKKWYVLCE